MKGFQQMKQLVKQTILYGLGGALQKLIGFFLFPIYAHLLSVSDFGASDLVLTTIFVISSVLALPNATSSQSSDHLQLKRTGALLAFDRTG